VSESAVLISIEGRRLELSGLRRSPDDSEPWSYTAMLTTESAQASAGVWDYGAGPAAFFRELAAEWKGWVGERSWSSLEGQLRIAAQHDGKGLIACEVTLGSMAPPTWSLAASMTFGAGAQMEEIASSVEAALASVQNCRSARLFWGHCLTPGCRGEKTPEREICVAIARRRHDAR
jgi:Family of unknown function (DUF6228)